MPRDVSGARNKNMSIPHTHTLVSMYTYTRISAYTCMIQTRLRPGPPESEGIRTADTDSESELYEGDVGVDIPCSTGRVCYEEHKLQLLCLSISFLREIPVVASVFQAAGYGDTFPRREATGCWLGKPPRSSPWVPAGWAVFRAVSAGSRWEPGLPAPTPLLTKGA